MKDISLSLFFPAYNEEANIEQAVAQATAAVKEITNQYEIIIVNDGSRDKTPDIADALAKKDTHIRVVHHKPNQGYGAAVWSGIQAARYDYVFFADSDLQFDLRDLKKLVAYVPEYKVVIGYRSKRRDPFFRLLNAKAWNILNRLLFGLKVKDIDCAFKLFERKLVVNLPIKSRGAMMSAELLIYLQRQGIPFKEVPVTHLPHRAGESTGAKPAVILRAFKELFQTYRGELGNVTQRQLIKFIIIGLANTILDILIYFILTRTMSYFMDHLVVAKIISYTIGSISSFIFNRRWTFRKADRLSFGEIVRFYITVAAALLINAVSLFVFLRIFPAHDLLAVLAATVITLLWNFTVSKFWVFTSEHRSPSLVKTSRRDWLLLWSLVATIAISSLIWLKADSYPPHWDMAHHLMNSLRYVDTAREIQESDTFYTLARKVYHFFIAKDTYYPPFAYWVSVPFVLVFGRTVDAAIYTNLLFLIALVFSTYAIGKKLWNPHTGLLAALIMVSYPFIASQFHEFQLDMPLLAMTTLAFWALLQTDKFRNNGWSFIFGALSGLAMLTKWPYPAFMIGPVLVILFSRIKEIRREEDYNSYFVLLKNIGWALLGLGIVAGPWYYKHIGGLRNNLSANWEVGDLEGDPVIGSWRWFRFYFDALLISHIRGILFVPFLIGLWATFRSRDQLKRNGLLLAQLIGGYIIMTIYNNKDYRFIEPVMLSVTILSVYWISLLKPPARQLLTGLLIALSIFHLLSSGWGAQLFPHVPAEMAITLPAQDGKKPYKIPFWQFQGYTAGAPRFQSWQQEEILNFLQQDAKNSGVDKPIQVAIYYKDNISFNEENFQYAIMQQNYPLQLYRGQHAAKNCQTLDYLIATDREGVAEVVQSNFPYYDQFAYNTEETKALAKLPRFNAPQCRLQLIYETPLPDATKAYLWKVVK